MKLWSRKTTDNTKTEKESEAPSPPPMRPRGPITALRVLRQGFSVKLDPERRSIVIGRSPPPSVDLQLMLPSVSRKHARLERGQQSIVVLDLNSTNGIARASYPVGYTIVDSLVINAGDRFALGRVELLALDEATYSLTEIFASYLKRQDKNQADLDCALEAVIRDYMLILHAPNNDATRPLAQAIHSSSPRRDYPFIEIAGIADREDEITKLLRRAAGGTIFINMFEPFIVPPTFTKHLLWGRFRVRVIIGTNIASIEGVLACFGPAFDASMRGQLSVCALGFGDEP